MHDPINESSPVQRVRVNETRISRAYSAFDLAALIQRDLLSHSARRYEEIEMRDSDTFTVELGKLPDSIDAQLVMQEPSY